MFSVEIQNGVHTTGIRRSKRDPDMFLYLDEHHAVFPSQRYQQGPQDI